MLHAWNRLNIYRYSNLEKIRILEIKFFDELITERMGSRNKLLRIKNDLTLWRAMDIHTLKRHFDILINSTLSSNLYFLNMNILIKKIDRSQVISAGKWLKSKCHIRTDNIPKSLDIARNLKTYTRSTR